MREVTLLYLLFFGNALFSQTNISGYVKDKNGDPIAYANVYLKGVFDGNSTDDEGYFSFDTSATGKVILVVSSVGYETYQKEVDLTMGDIRTNIVLNRGGNNLEEVVISIGTFEASDKKKGTNLKPLDIVTNPGSAGDIFGALATLPGVTPVGNETGLFVRGGEASETKTYIDGSLVLAPFFSEVPDIPARGRFNPFLFSGTLFTTGGYSAEYGQALSSVLLLETNDFPTNDNYSFGMNMAGVNAAFTKTWNKKTALLFSMNYTDLSALFAIVPQNRNWSRAPQGTSGSVGFRHYNKRKGLFKSFLQYRDGGIGLSFPSAEGQNLESSFQNDNKNLFWNNSFNGKIWNNWKLFVAASFSYDEDIDQFNTNKSVSKDILTQSRATLSKKYLGNELRVGGEVQIAREELSNSQQTSSVENTLSAFYAESDIKVTKGIAVRVGLRMEKASIIEASNFAPRLSLTAKTGRKSNFSLAYGKFYQTPQSDFLRVNQTSDLNFELATHYIANYQWKMEDRFLRVEAYYKDYDHLVREGSVQDFTNEGYGFAKGIDIFWNDQKLIKNLNYWISYSLIDSKRLYREFPTLATPTFVSTHNLNVVANYNATPLLRVGMSYTYASGRTYFNPNNPDFLSDRTIDFHNMNFNGSYLTSLFGNFTVIYVSLRNPFIFRQIFGYRYSEDGSSRNPIIPASDWSFFAGISISIQK